MKKTLIVNYTPRIDSNTQKMVDSFIEKNKDRTEVSILDLANNPPDLLLRDSLNLYIKRNYMCIPLSPAESKILETNDLMLKQVIDTDYIVLAFPMYNFSLPATVKAWIDAITQAGNAFKMGEKGYEGLIKNTKAMVLMTSGGDFEIEPYKSLNFASPLIKATFHFIGISTQIISAFGLQQYSARAETILSKAIQEMENLSDQWYR